MTGKPSKPIGVVEATPADVDDEALRWLTERRRVVRKLPPERPKAKPSPEQAR
jgi:hypothetical protein